MTPATNLERLRTALHLLSIVFFLGTIVELIAAKHYQAPMQLVPFALCAIGIILAAIVWRWPTIGITRVTRIAMLIVAAGSLLGTWEHIQSNLEFVSETNKHADTWTKIVATFQGRSPALAPFALAAGASVLIMATWVTPRAASSPRLLTRTHEPGQEDLLRFLG